MSKIKNNFWAAVVAIGLVAVPAMIVGVSPVTVLVTNLVGICVAVWGSIIRDIATMPRP